MLSRKSLGLNRLIIPWRYSRDPLDVALAWHVADLLGGCAQLTLHFAEQLEMLGCWESRQSDEI